MHKPDVKATTEDPGGTLKMFFVHYFVIIVVVVALRILLWRRGSKNLPNAVSDSKQRQDNKNRKSFRMALKDFFCSQFLAMALGASSESGIYI